MSSFWLKFKIWSKVVVFSLIGLYVLLFVIGNRDRRVDGVVDFPFLAQFHHPRLLTVLIVTAVVSIVGWWLLRTIIKTVRQIREVRERGRQARLEKELAAIKNKAGMLQTRDASPATEPASVTTSPVPTATRVTPEL